MIWPAGGRGRTPEYCPAGSCKQDAARARRERDAELREQARLGAIFLSGERGYFRGGQRGYVEHWAPERKQQLIAGRAEAVLEEYAARSVRSPAGRSSTG